MRTPRPRRTWGSAHTLTVENPTLGKTGIKLIDNIFNRGPIATGNSGHTYNANYVDQLDAWNSGQQFSFAFTRAAVQQAGTNTLTLQP